MKSDKQTSAIFLRKTSAVVEGQSERSRMRLKINQAGSFKRFLARICHIDIVVKIRVVNIFSITKRPSIILPSLDEVDFIRWSVVTQPVPSILGSIHLASWAKNKTNSVP